jgi:hypothetical protein
MTDDQKMEVASMLQQMILADGVQDKREMYLWSQIVLETGIDKTIERKTAGMNTQCNEPQIYLNSSKVALSRRSPEYLHMVDEQAGDLRNMYRNRNLSADDKCDIIIKYVKECVKNSGWDLKDVDGVTWFIANIIDAMVKAGLVDDYDTMFVNSFKKYFG